MTKSGKIPIAQQFIEESVIAALVDACLQSGKEEISHGQVVNVMLLNLLDGWFLKLGKLSRKKGRNQG